MVAHTGSWEQQVAQHLDKHPGVLAFVTNEFLELAIPYVENGQDHDYYPDFLVRLADDPRFTLILEVKGRPDPLEQVKAAAARRWVAAVNAEESFGRWGYTIVRDLKDTYETVDAARRFGPDLMISRNRCHPERQTVSRDPGRSTPHPAGRVTPLTGARCPL